MPTINKCRICLRLTFFIAIVVFLVCFFYSDFKIMRLIYKNKSEIWFRISIVRAIAFDIYLVSIALFVAALFFFNDAIKLGATQAMVEKNSWHFAGSTAISVARFMVYGWCLGLRLHYLSNYETNPKQMLRKVLTSNIMIAY